MWKHQSKTVGRPSSNMEEKKDQASYQRKYRKRVNAINRINAAFMKYAEENAPELVASFFKSEEVTLSEITVPFLVKLYEIHIPLPSFT